MVPEKINIPTQKKVIRNLRGREMSKAKIFKGKYELRLELPEGWEKEIQTNKLSIGGVGIKVFLHSVYEG